MAPVTGPGTTAAAAAARMAGQAQPPDPREVERLRKTAQDFEAIFIKQMLKSMRQASTASGPLSGASQYQDLADDELARSIARGGGFGLADALTRDLARLLTAGKNPSSPAGSDPISGNRSPGGSGGARP